jgi:hypothetical protein
MTIKDLKAEIQKNETILRNIEVSLQKPLDEYQREYFKVLRLTLTEELKRLDELYRTTRNNAITETLQHIKRRRL